MRAGERMEGIKFVDYVGKMRNMALRGAIGRQSEYVFFIDAGDLIEPTALEKYAWFLESNQQVVWVS